MGGALRPAPGGRRKKRLKVAAAFGRAEFSCSACAREEAQGGDPKGRRSGAPRACAGPKQYRFFDGAATWSGCPRLALGAREAAWIDVRDRAGGRMSVSEQLVVPSILIDAFEALEELEAQAAAHARQMSEQQAQGSRPGVLS